MPSTFMGIEIGKRSLIGHNLGLNTIGHNLSNASVEGYSRQRVEMKAFPPIYMPGLNRELYPGQIGQGMEATRIERIKDMLLEGRIVSETGGEGYWAARDKYLLLLEQIYNEPTEFSVRSHLDRFWAAWQELSVNPTEVAARQQVLQRGQALIDAVHNRYFRLKETRDMIEGDVLATVEEVNELGREIAALGEQIVKIQALGDNPNDLMDRRDLLVGRLGELVDVTIGTQDPDEFIVYTGGRHLIQGRHYEELVAAPDPNNDSYSRVAWGVDGETLQLRGGKLLGLLEMRDVDAREEIQKLDLLTVNFVDLVNDVHRRSYGLNGRTGIEFFSEYPFINNLAGNYDRNGDGEYDSSYIFRITGTNVLEPKEQVGLTGTMLLPGITGRVAVEYYPTDTVEDLVRRINTSGAEVAARLDQAGRLTLKGVPAAVPGNADFVLRHVEDTGQFLVGYAGVLQASGPEGAFDWETADAVLTLQGAAQYAVAPQAHPAGWIEVNPALRRDPLSVATSFEEGGEAFGDGSAALAIANLRTEPVVLGATGSFDEYLSAVVTDAGLRGEIADTALETQKLVLKELTDMRESLSGVNIDEELTQMIKYQHGYAAAARFITEVDRMIDTIINRMGV
ncbi:MAG: flagellar hook-associated protein FlgK [Spirochaetales bacterium]|nr:flagellar hook-associated protein FlgK [Spirochaetales bacterium]